MNSPANHLSPSPLLKTDCRHFRSDRPCAPHKLRGKICASCDEYDPSASRALIVKLAAMGDVLRTTCILRGLKAKYNAPVVWITRPDSVALLQHNPFIEEIWTTDEALASRLETEPFRAVINPDADRFSAALCAMARGREKIGYALDTAGNVLPLNAATRRWHAMSVNDELKRQNQKTYQQLIADAVGIPARDNELIFSLTKDERAEARKFAAKKMPPTKGAVIGFNTGGAERWKRKQWTFNGFLNLGKRLLRDTPHTIILYGGRSEVEFNQRLRAKLGSRRVLNVNTKKSVREFASMLSLCDVLVTGDTLGMHIASALGKQQVVIFGPTSAAEIELYGRGTKIVPEMSCQSYYRPECAASPCCVDTLTVERVFAAIEKAVAATIPSVRR